MIRDNINSGTKVILDEQNIKCKQILLEPYSDEQLNDIIFDTGDDTGTIITNPVNLRLINHNDNLCGIYVTYVLGSSYTRYGTYFITSSIGGLSMVRRFESTYYTSTNYDMEFASLISYGGYIHVFCDTSHYRISDIHEPSLIEYSNTIPLGNDFPIYSANSIIYDDTICVICSRSNRPYFANLYLWSGEEFDEWTLMATIPVVCASTLNCLMYNNNIHFVSGIGGSFSSEYYYTNTHHYMYDGEVWTLLGYVPSSPKQRFNNFEKEAYAYHGDIFYHNYIWDNGVWVRLDITNHDISNTFAVYVFDDTEIHAVAFDKTSNKYKHYCNPYNRFKCIIEN